MVTDRDNYFDCMKAWLIICMVVGHAGCSCGVRSFIYLFHMPLFFVLAGWFMREGHQNILKFAGKRLGRLWLPYVVWGVLFCCMHNKFVDWGIYADETKVGGMLGSCGISSHWPIEKMLTMCWSVFIFKGGDFGMASAFWFLRATFFASISYVVVSYLIEKFGWPKYYQDVLAILVLCVSHYYVPGLLRIPLSYVGGCQCLTAYGLIHLGVTLRRYCARVDQFGKMACILMVAVSLVVLLLIAPFFNFELADNKYPSVIILLVTTILGWLLVGGIAAFTSFNWVAYIGKHTMPILIFHLLAFKLVSLVGAMFFLPFDRTMVAKYPVAYTGFWWCVGYALVGIGIPLLVNELFWRCTRKVLCKTQKR